MTRGSLLLVDDDRLVLDAMADWLRARGHRVAEASTRSAALAKLDQMAFDLVLCDIRLQEGTGFDVLEHCQQSHPETTVILLTGYATADTAVEAIRAGAFGLLTKPLIDEELASAIDRALSQRRVIEENARLQAGFDLRFGLEGIVGRDQRMVRVFEMIDSIADTKATVLLSGESGTGKSLIARAIHRHSARRDRPFVEVACGALPETLLETELFGHVTGAFTGAVADRRGKFMQSDGGTIFLDEIGTSSPNLQVKLLRILQDFEFEQVGGGETFRLDTRVILATNEDLGRAVAAGRFRQDLYYRINVINVELPPLRERVADIPGLADHFLHRICEETGKRVHGFSSAAMAHLQSYAWPGNIRELQNAVERAVLLGKHAEVMPEDLPREVTAGAPVATTARKGRTLKQALEGPERAIILEALRDHHWNRNETAVQLGINRTTLYKKMKRLGLEEPYPGGAWMQAKSSKDLFVP